MPLALILPRGDQWYLLRKPLIRRALHMYVCMVIIYYSRVCKSMDQPGRVANPARGQLNKEKIIFPCPRSRLRVWSRETGSAVPWYRLLTLLVVSWTGKMNFPYPRSRLIIWCLLTGFLPICAVASIYSFKQLYAIGSVPRLSGHHAIAYWWSSLQRVRRHGASTPQGSSSNGCCLSTSPWTN